MPRLHDAGVLEQLVSRLERLDAEAPGRWGRMDVGQMICHLADAFRWGLGERTGTEIRLPVPAWVARFVALRLPLPWPRGAPTMPEMDQRVRGTPPGDFQQDRAELVELLRRFAALESGWPRHPLFGAMSRDDWGRWAWRHTDHHLRQFGA